MNMEKKILLLLAILLLVMISISGCSSLSFREFPRSRSEYVNISFQYPRGWKLQKEFDSKITTHEGWLLDIPELDSELTIYVQQWPDSQEANEKFSRVFSNYYVNLEPDLMGKEEIEVCGKSFPIYRYYQPEVIENDFIINESNKLDIAFVHDNVYYIFSVMVLIPEQSKYAEIEEGFLSIIESITCD